MQKEIEITIAPEFVNNEQTILQNLAKALNVSPAKINNFKILKRSIDARSRKVIFRLQVRAYINEIAPASEPNFTYPSVKDKRKVKKKILYFEKSSKTILLSLELLLHQSLKMSLTKGLKIFFSFCIRFKIIGQRYWLHSRENMIKISF